MRGKQNRIQAQLAFLLSLFLFCSPAAGARSAAAEKPADAPQTLTISIVKGETALFEKQYTVEELMALPQTRQAYTSMDDDGTPQLILAEGILLSDLLESLGVKQADVQNLRVYSADGWNRGFTGKFLLGTARYSYPDYLPQTDPPDEAEETPPAVPEPEPVSAMLALASREGAAADGEDWSRVGTEKGMRICYGQLNPDDVCSTLYGSNLEKLEISLTKNSAFGTDGGEQAPDPAEEGVVVSKDTYDDNAVSGAQTGEIPSTLTVKAGYAGYGFEERKVFTVDALKQLPIVTQAYTLREGSDIVVDTAMGVRLSDILAAAGIDTEQAAYLNFYTGGAVEEVRLSKSELFDVPRYFYPRLPQRWDGAAGSPLPGAAVGAERVDALLAFRDDRAEGATAPDFYRMDGKRRFCLVLGQMSARTQTAAQTVPWIHTIEVMLSGEPPKQAGSGQAGLQPSAQKGAAPRSPGTSDGTESGSKDPGGAAYQAASSENTAVSLPKLHVYEVNGQEEAPSDQRKTPAATCAALMSACAVLGGSGTKYMGYRKREPELIYGETRKSEMEG